MVHSRQRLGQDGERLAADYLRRHRLRVLAANVRTPFGELDLVARSGDTLLSVEVKSRRGARGVPPVEQVTPRKRRRLMSATEWYAAQQAWEGPVVLACLGIDFATTPATFTWIPDITL